MATDTDTEDEGPPTRPRSSTWWERLKWTFFPTRAMFLFTTARLRLMASIKEQGRRVRDGAQALREPRRRNYRRLPRRCRARRLVWLRTKKR